MKILVVGSGAREHTLVWKIARSKKTSQLYAAPGNAGTARIARNLDIKADDIEGLVKAAGQNKIDLVVVGPENPLSEGIVDRFQAAGIPIFGPTRAAAQIESSKVFAKELMEANGIPCARSRSFTDYEKAVDYVKRQQPPIVVKADGLAAGKGVIIAESVPEALEALAGIMKEKTLGAAGDRVLIEECLTGREMSTFTFSDGRTVLPMLDACDYKRIYDGDRGPNTGGMGSFSPPYFHTPELGEKVLKTIMEPTARALAGRGMPYKGLLYGGLMITDRGPKVLEFNARFGDPETQVVLPRLKTDLVEIMLAVINGTLDRIKLEYSREACVGVVVASAGYPGSYKTGFPISGLDSLDKEIMVFHAGTKTGPEGRVLTSGGRVLTVAATGRDLAQARKKVYANISRVHFEGSQYRKDIALIKN